MYDYGEMKLTHMLRGMPLVAGRMLWKEGNGLAGIELPSFTAGTVTADGYPRMKEFERYGWRGCWRCQHCLAVCPKGAISIFGKDPKDSFLPASPEMCGYMERLIVNRRSCSRFLKKNVEPEMIFGMLALCLLRPRAWQRHYELSGRSSK